MARLQVLRNGQKIKEVDLKSNQEWIIGRAANVDIVLEGEPGISRQHLKLVSQNGQWQAEVLSRYGELYQNGQKVQLIELGRQAQFEVPPFQFIFEETNSQSGVVMDTSDRTFVGQLAVVPQLKVCNAENETMRVFRLDGNSWVAGRDTSCSLFIENKNFSRRHFEIRLEEGAYLIKDLGSSNGTLLNGEPLSILDWTPIRSGDVLTVVDWNLYFELRDSSFENKLQEIPQELLNPLVYNEDVPAGPISLANHPGLSEASGETEEEVPAKKKVNWVRMAIGLVIIIGAVLYVLDGGQQKPAPVAKQGASPFDKLPPQQQQYIRDSYRLADRLFKEGRYEMARQEVAKIHQLVPSFEESKNLEKLADIAIQTQVDQQKAEAQEREKAEMEEKIQKVVAQCSSKINGSIDMKTIDDCLSPVIPLNPDHPSILNLKSRVDQIVAERTARQERQAEYSALARKQKALFEKAEGLNKSGKPLDAIAAYGNVVGSKLPDPQDLKSQARRQIASIQKQLTEKQGTLEKEADDAIKKGDLKTAIQTLKKGIDINPENETLKGRVNSLLVELKKQMQTLYQEGVLEESVGEVETAKAKWKKIVDTSVPEEDYYKKAKSKLKKYGAE